MLWEPRPPQEGQRGATAAALLASHPSAPGLVEVMHLAWEQHGQLVGALHCPELYDQAERSAGSEQGPFPSPGLEGDVLAAYVSCPLGLCAKLLWDGQAMTQVNSKL